MRRVLGFVLAAVLAVTGLTACMSDESSSSSRSERRSAALIEAGQEGPELQLTLNGITPAGEAIEVLSYSWGGRAPVTGGAQFDELKITKTIDEVSPKLFEALALHRLIPAAELKLFKNFERGGVEYGSYLMDRVFVTSVQIAGAAQGESLPMEEVSFAYQRIRETTQMPDGEGRQGPPVQFGWDLQARQPW